MPKMVRSKGAPGGVRSLGVHPSTPKPGLGTPLGARVARPGVMPPPPMAGGIANQSQPPLGFRPIPQVGAPIGGQMPASRQAVPGPYAKAPITATARPFDGTSTPRGAAPKRRIAGKGRM